jgi:hypothetical protein
VHNLNCTPSTLGVYKARREITCGVCEPKKRSRKCGSLDASELNGPPLPTTATALPLRFHSVANISADEGVMTTVSCGAVSIQRIV